MKYWDKSADNSHRMTYTYDAMDNLTRRRQVTNGDTEKTYSYDSSRRLYRQVAKADGTTVLTETVTFHGGSDHPSSSVTAFTSGQIKKYTSTYANGALAYTYTYDPWGNILTTTASNNTMYNTLAQYDPLRYRGYVYDRETGLYYLQSRYYDPEMGRFLNADVYISTGQGFLGNNMFAYCLNDPVNYVDRSGKNTEAVRNWMVSMWWLCAADGVLPVGELVYGAGILVFGICMSEVVEEIATSPISMEEERSETELEPLMLHIQAMMRQKHRRDYLERARRARE